MPCHTGIFWADPSHLARTKVRMHLSADVIFDRDVLVGHLRHADLRTAIADLGFARLARALLAIILDGDAAAARDVPK